MRDPPEPKLRSISTRLYLFAIVAALVGPGLAFTGLLISRYEASERAAYDQQARNIARQVANAVDRDLAGLATTLQTLSTSPRLASGDREGFYDQANAVKSFIGADVSLRDLSGDSIVDTRVSVGASAPRENLAADQAATETGMPVVSGVFRRAPGGVPVFAVVSPIRRGGQPHQLLQISAPTGRVAEIVRKDLPAGWVIGVADRRGNYVARSERHEEFTGKPGRSDFLSQMTGQSGSFVSRSAFGTKVLVGYAKSSESEWTIAASVPRSVIEAPLRRDLWMLAGFGATALAISTLLTSWLWHQIAHPLRLLTEAGRAIGTSRADFDIRSPIREIALLSEAMAAASTGLLERDALRQATEAALRDSELGLQRANEALEGRVAERTRDLIEMNEALRSEMVAREAVEGQLRQVQKMEAIGQLSGGIAHDFNNMLAIIVGGLNLAKTRLARGEADVMRFIEAAAQGAQRAAALTSRLLAYARQQPLAPRLLDVNRLLANTTELLHRALGETIHLETVLGAGLWQIHADASQLESTILNLAVNSRDAMPDGGRLTIETSNCVLDERFCRENSGVSAGQYVAIMVADTGSGMTDEVAARAFDPFFTTKDVGKGTGLGLSQVYGYVRQSGGHVKIHSEPGRGTTVTVYLPRSYADADFASLRAEEGGAPLAHAPDETVLVVEDEDAVRQVTIDALSELGYRTLGASSGAAALSLLRQEPPIDLLLTDIVMPVMNGRRLADEARALRPGLRVLYMTGFTRESVVHDGMPEPGLNVLLKPFTLAQLASKVRASLNNDEAASHV